MNLTVVDKPGNGKGRVNRAPLQPGAMGRLPLGAVQPAGWLRHQLDLMVEGMTGRLAELSGFLEDSNGWFGTDHEGWEEQPYWLRGFYDLAVLTGDPRCREIAHRWIEAVLGRQDPDGYFGARAHKHVVCAANGQAMADLWPHMVMLDAVISHYEHTQDERVIPFMTRFFQFCRALPDERFMPPPRPGYEGWKPLVQRERAGDMLPHLYWLYNHTGEAALLDLAIRCYRRIAPPCGEWLDKHVVNFTQRFAYPAVFATQSGEAWHVAQTEYWYAQHLATWGQQPRGLFAADERVRPGKTDPRQGFETCAMVEFAKSFNMLGRLTGDARWADRCEDVMLNHFPAAQTPDLKALHYLTASNLPQCDAAGQHDFHNGAGMLLFSPYHRFRCCQHNVAMGWPSYARNLWQASTDGGLVAWLYGASQVKAGVGRGRRRVTLDCRTEYPFREQVAMTVRLDGGRGAGSVDFPLYLRIPGWCHGIKVAVNGRTVRVPATTGRYVRIERGWGDGDTVRIAMPASITLTPWLRTGAVTVDRGPLSYSVRIDERWQKCGPTHETERTPAARAAADAWPEWEILPASPWNYGLVLDRKRARRTLKLARRRKVTGQPWTVEAAPIEIEARARRIPHWPLQNDMAPPLEVSPVRSDAPTEMIALIPLGCARLRMSCLPVIGEGPEGI